MITDRQLQSILALALPGARLREARPMGGRSLLLELAGRRAVLRLAAPPDPAAGDPLAAEAAALAALRAEIDLPLPELLAYEPQADQPFLLLSYLEGAPLPELLETIDEDGRYAVGRALGVLAARAHAYQAAYGPLDPARPPELAAADGPADAGDDERAYLVARVESGLAAALAAGEADEAGAAAIRGWLAASHAASGRPACLVHGDLRPERLLLRRRDGGWRLSGLAGWGFAQGWRPAWDHVCLLEHFPGQEYFSLRAGYGNAYDETTERRYDQLRELALAPYRLARLLEAGRADLALALAQGAGEGEGR